MKIMKYLCAGCMVFSLGACASTATSSSRQSSSDDETPSRVTVKYESVYDDSEGYSTQTFHEMTYDMVKGWAPRRMSQDDGLTYLARGQKDSIEVHFVEGGSDTEAMKAYIESEEMKTYADAVVSTEEMEVAGKEGLYVQAIDTVTATIMADGNKDFYMIPSDGGFYFISFTFDPYGKVDYSNAYAHIVDSITIG